MFDSMHNLCQNLDFAQHGDYSISDILLNHYKFILLDSNENNNINKVSYNFRHIDMY